MPAFEHILFEQEASVATLTLNRPQALNALTFGMMDEIDVVLTLIKSDHQINALVITGAGRGFCSGQDLRNRPGAEVDVVTALMDCYFRTMNAIRHCRVPVITAVNGIAAGGGCSMALLGDMTLAAQSAVFYPGVQPYWPGTRPRFNLPATPVNWPQSCPANDAEQ